MGVLTIRLVEARGAIVGALVVGPRQEILVITESGTVQRTAVDGISQMGRATQGVIVQRLREGDRISAVAMVDASVESDGPEGEPLPLEVARRRGARRPRRSRRSPTPATTCSTTPRRRRRRDARRGRRRTDEELTPEPRWALGTGWTRRRTCAAGWLRRRLLDRLGHLGRGRRMSIGIGRIVVALFDDEISSSVCR